MLTALGCGLTCGISFADDVQNSITATKVITFKPNGFRGKTGIGYCFSSSIALERSDAWRCRAGDSIYDPCFTTSVKNKLICDADPVTNRPGFPLQIAKALPQTTNTSSVSTKPWILMLEDGSVCTAYTGTMPVIPYGESMMGLKYGCVGGANSAKNQSSGIVDGSIDTSEKVWQANLLMYSVKNNGGGPQDVQIAPVNIKTVWQ